MKIGMHYISTGFVDISPDRSVHLLVALHKSWRLAWVKPGGKSGYRRLDIGPIEIEMSSIKWR